MGQGGFINVPDLWRTPSESMRLSAEGRSEIFHTEWHVYMDACVLARTVCGVDKELDSNVKPVRGVESEEGLLIIDTLMKDDEELERVRSVRNYLADTLALKGDDGLLDIAERAFDRAYKEAKVCRISRTSISDKFMGRVLGRLMA